MAGLHIHVVEDEVKGTLISPQTADKVTLYLTPETSEARPHSAKNAKPPGGDRACW